MTESWSYATFVLYLAVTWTVTGLCRAAARARACMKIHSAESNFQTSSRVFREGTSFGGVLFLKKEMMYECLAYVILVLLATVRSSQVGSDTAVYVEWFQSGWKFSFNPWELFTFQQMEPGFQLFMVAVRSITDNYHVFFFLAYGMIAASYIAYIRYFFDENSDYLFLQIFIFFYVSNMSGMRAAMGMIFLLPSFITLSQKKYGKSIVLTVLACCFHYTMIFNAAMIALVWILSSPLFKRRRWVMPMALAAAVIVSYVGLGFMNRVIASTKYGYYTTNIKDLSLLGSAFYMIFAILLYAFYHEIMIFMQKHKKYESVYYTAVAFVITYPAVYLTMAYRIPNYYAMPRLTMWSVMERMGEKKFLIREREWFRLGMQIIIILYLMFRFTRSAQDGSFLYRIME